MKAERQRQHMLDAEQEAERVAAVKMYEVCSCMCSCMYVCMCQLPNSSMTPSAPDHMFVLRGHVR